MGEKQQTNKQNGFMTVAVGFTLAAIAGAVIGILAAPQSGSETRRQLARKADKLRGTAKKRANEAADQISDVTDKAKERLK